MVHSRVQRLPTEPNVCLFDYLQCGADDGFGMLLELLQETEKASIIRTAAYLRNLQQAAQADSLSNVMGSKTSTNHKGRLCNIFGPSNIDSLQKDSHNFALKTGVAPRR